MTQQPSFDGSHETDYPQNSFSSQQQTGGYDAGQYGSHPGYGQQAAGAELPPHAFGEGSEGFWRPSDDDKTLAWVAHLLGILTSFVGPLIIFLIKKDQSLYIRHHAAQSLNIQIYGIIGYTISAILSLIVIGGILAPIIGIAIIVFEVLGILSATKGQGFKLPVLPAMIK